MTENRALTDGQALKSWYKALLDVVVQDMLKAGAVVGAAVEATPVWVMPQKILIARIWGVGQENRFIWTISGGGVITDHIAGFVAATPQDVAKHFSLKWQADAERLFQVAKRKGLRRNAGKRMEASARRLIYCAEFLYDLANQDDIWQHQLAD